MKKWLIQLFFVLIIIVVSSLVVYNNIYEKCDSSSCFNEHLLSCKRAVYVERQEAWYHYRIRGFRGESCLVEVKAIHVENLQYQSILGETMKCLLPPKTIISPTEDLGYCTGGLKEKLQDITISRLYRYIYQNLEKFDN